MSDLYILDHIYDPQMTQDWNEDLLKSRVFVELQQKLVFL